MSIAGPFKLKAQVMCGPEPAIGPGKALVLEAIHRTGSISAAGRELGMSYRRTWLLVDSMNRCWTQRLVDTSKGNGAALTDHGHAILRAFRALEVRLETAAFSADYQLLLDGLRNAPKPPAAATPEPA